MKGFLGTQATFREDLNLLVQFTMGIALLFGMFLAKRKRFTAHMYCQSSVMLLNLIMIGLIMFPSFHRQVVPHFHEVAHDSYYGVAAIHAGLGMIAELLGLYIVLRAATNFLPVWLRFKKYKPWMRTELALWWVVLFFGIATYSVWYVLPIGKNKGNQAVASPSAVQVTLTNFEFTPKAISIPIGTTISWVDKEGRHKVLADDNSFESPVLVFGNHFEHKFDQAGSFPYHCDFHGDKGGKDMAGKVEVTP